MRKRSFNIALTRALAGAFAFTAVPAQIIFASGVNAKVRTAKMVGPNNTYQHADNVPFFLGGGSERSGGHCNVNVRGHMLDC